MYLLDTSILISLTRERSPALRTRFEQFGLEELAVSAVTVGELRYGAEKSMRSAEAHVVIDRLASLVDILPLDPTVARTYGEVRALLERSGPMIGNNDLWIASHALAVGRTLVTGTQREFARVPGLVVENWS
jgi:tRNA(fMet)-specific endonuclease VapC